MTWIKKQFNKLEDPKRPLLGPNVKWLKLWGLLLPKNKLKKTMYMIICYLLVIFVITEYIDIWVSRSDIKLVLQGMKYTMMTTINAMKAVTFLIWQKEWISIIDYVTDEDVKRRQTNDKVSQDKMTKYTKYCRKLFTLYVCMTYTSVTTAALQPLFQYAIFGENESTSSKYVEVVNSWVPFDKNTWTGYLIAVIFQTLMTFWMGGWLSSFDTICISVLIFFKAELELLRRDCQFLFGTEDSSNTKLVARTKLSELHERHNKLIKYSRLFDSCLSPIMLLYVIVCSVMLCATAYQINIETTAIQKFLTAEFLIFGISQLFMFCWHSNEVFYVSMDLILGPYESIWWTRSLSEMKDIYILSEQFRNPVVFSAGPFISISLATFISILKGAYSYYTLLSQSQTEGE